MRRQSREVCKDVYWPTCSYSNVSQHLDDVDDDRYLNYNTKYKDQVMISTPNHTEHYHYPPIIGKLLEYHN